jgi:hypothetical protein
MTRIEYGELVHHHSDPAVCRKFAICSEQECLRRSQWNPAPGDPAQQSNLRRLNVNVPITSRLLVRHPARMKK